MQFRILWQYGMLSGMAGYVAQSSAACRSIAKRLVEVTAPGLTGRLDALPPRLVRCREASRPIAAVEELGQLHLMAEAYRRQDDQSPSLRADVRQAIGWPVLSPMRAVASAFLALTSLCP
jgi:hypothetical protein